MLVCDRLWLLAGLVSPWVSLVTTLPAPAQITPDATLGSEASQVAPGVEVRGNVADLIEGGAIRGSNLFHSFLEFNLDEGQRVYFANPAGIESILSRITGSDPSNIFGTLGVDGTADLFLINPHGLVFGKTAALDIEGSFYASTAEAIELGDGVYSATEPEQSSLLTVNPSAVFSSYLTDASGDIENRGALAVQQNMTLAANNLDLQGQVAAGGDLTLLGLDTVQIRDTAAVPLVGFAGGDLLVQGNEQVDIVALSHRDSGLYSYGNMVLRSANPVGGDAHYWSRGSFRVEELNRNAGRLFSPVDPIIRTFGDVVISEYTGTSLHILAGGAVTIGIATIIAPDTGASGINFLQESVELSDGTVVEINGGVQPTLDVRGGIAPQAISAPPLEILTGFNLATDVFSRADVTETPSSADITVGDVVISASDGLVLLTNQYQPNNQVSGGNILIESQLAPIAGFGGILAGSPILGIPNGSTIFLDSRNDISVVDSIITTISLEDSGRDIVLLAEGTLRLDSPNGRPTAVVTNTPTVSTIRGGEIRIVVTNLELTNGAQLNAITQGIGDAGNVGITARDRVIFDGTSADGQSASAAFSSVSPGAIGSGGDIVIDAGSLYVLNGAQLVASTFGSGDAGSVKITASDRVVFDGTSADGQFSSAASSEVSPGAVGTGGNVVINAGFLDVLNGSRLAASTFGLGDAGSVLLEIAETVRFVGFNSFDGRPSGASSTIQLGGEGTGGNVVVRAANLEVLGGAQLNATTFSIGDAGSIILEIAETARFVGFNPSDGSPTGVFNVNGTSSFGDSGNIYVAASNLEVGDGAQLNTAIFGSGSAGDINILVSETASFDGFNSSNANTDFGIELVEGEILLGDNRIPIITASIRGFRGLDGSGSNALSSIETGGEGNSGNVLIAAENLIVTNGARISTLNAGIGNAGNIIIETQNAHFDGFNSQGGSPSGVASIIQGGTGASGNINLRATDLVVSNGAQLSTAPFGNGIAGNIAISVDGTARFSGFNNFNNTASGIFSNLPSNNSTMETTSAGGNIALSANQLEILDAASISTASFSNNSSGNIQINVSDRLQMRDGTIETASLATSGGTIELSAFSILLEGDSDIQTFVLSGQEGGGDITLNANLVIAFDDSDILAFSQDGTGGNIFLNTPAFFGENLRTTLQLAAAEDFGTLEGNNRVDINASGGIASGVIETPDVSFVANSLSAFEDNIIDTAALTVGSCIARTTDDQGSFVVTGRDGLPQRPGDTSIAAYLTGTVRTSVEPTAALQEPDGVYQLPDGRLVLSRTCD